MGAEAVAVLRLPAGCCVVLGSANYVVRRDIASRLRRGREDV